MNSIFEVIQRVEKKMSAGVRYPEPLLRRFRPDVEFDRIIKSYLVDGGQAGGYYHWLTLLAQESGARLIVELGNRHGTSTLALAQGLAADATLLTIDIMRDQRYIPEEIFQDPRIKFLWGDVLDLTIYASAGMEIPLDIEILWTDTVHFYDQLNAEFRVYEPLLADEALIVIDDIHLNDKGRFFDETPFAKWDLSAQCHSSGFGAIHYVRPAAERNRSASARRQTAFERSTHQGYENFWRLFHEHEALERRIAENIFLRWPLKLERRIKRLFEGRNG